MTWRGCWFSLIFAPLAGCSLSGADLASPGTLSNSCKTSDDCPGGRCRDGLCIGSNGSLTSLLVSVTPPPTVAGADLNSLTFFKTFPDPADGTLAASGGGEPLNLEPAIDVFGSVAIDTSGCSPLWQGPEAAPIETSDTGLIPANVVFTPSVRAFGVEADSYSAKSGGENQYNFSQTLPDGAYDVYITPEYPIVPPMDALDACKVPPHLVLEQTVTATLDFKFAQASTQPVEVTWPLSAPYSDDLAAADPFFANPLYGWTLDLVDPNTGRVLSTEELLTSPTPPIAGAAAVSYELTLVYSPVYTRVDGAFQPSAVGGEILRLTPPAFDPRITTTPVPLTAPTILAQLDGALVGVAAASGKSSSPAQIVQSTPLPAPVTVEFQTALADGTPVAAGVLLRATEIDGIDGISTSFWRSVQVGADGLGTVDLLPGHYRVIASATATCIQGTCLGSAITDWVVAPQPALQAGKLLEFDAAPHYAGTAFVGADEPAVGATVTAVSAPFLADSNVLNVGDGSTAPAGRASAGTVDASGAFDFDADDGTYALRIEPDPNSGYGWFVRPTLNLPADADANQQLPEIDMDFPIGYFGSVNLVDASGASTPVPGALIRAYVYVNPDGTFTSTPTAGTVALQVAETYSGDEGHDSGAYTLLIPKTLDFEP